MSQAGGGQPRTEELWGLQRQEECRLTSNPRAGHQYKRTLIREVTKNAVAARALTNAAPLPLSTVGNLSWKPQPHNTFHCTRHNGLISTVHWSRSVCLFYPNPLRPRILIFITISSGPTAYKLTAFLEKSTHCQGLIGSLFLLFPWHHKLLWEASYLCFPLHPGILKEFEATKKMHTAKGLTSASPRCW